MHTWIAVLVCLVLLVASLRLIYVWLKNFSKNININISVLATNQKKIMNEISLSEKKITNMLKNDISGEITKSNKEVTKLKDRLNELNNMKSKVESLGREIHQIKTDVNKIQKQ